MKMAYYLTVPLAAAAISAVGVGVAGPAFADCVSSNGTTLCSQGDARGADTGSGVGVPYPCELDWYCDYDYGWELGVILDPGHDNGPPPDSGRPPRPNNDLPGRGGGGRGGRR